MNRIGLYSLVIASLTALAAPASAAPALQFIGKGVQIYTCQTAGAGFAWALQGPEAVLTDASGKIVGRHFAGPTWQASDGSAVVGEPLVASPSPSAGSVAWLVLHAKAHTGAGVFADIGYIVRTGTDGGAAPSMGCDAAHAASQVREPYSATYTFFPQAPPK
jgi:hypothetical protein